MLSLMLLNWLPTVNIVSVFQRIFCPMSSTRCVFRKGLVLMVARRQGTGTFSQFAPVSDRGRMFLSKVLQAENLLQVTKKLPGRGIGTRLQRLAWKEDSYWTLTAVKPSLDGDHGVASGVLTWKGEVQSEKPRRINGVLKKVWRHMQPSTKLEWQTPPKAAEQEASV